MSETINVIEIVWVNHEVVIVEDPNGQFFGYAYCSWSEWNDYAPIVGVGKLVDEHTLEVSGYR